MPVGQVQTIISRTSKKVMAIYTEPSCYSYHYDFFSLNEMLMSTADVVMDSSAHPAIHKTNIYGNKIQ